MPSKYPRFLMWTDFESTTLPNGNDFSDVHILEVAILVTNLDLTPLKGLKEVIAMTPEAAQSVRGNQYVKDMHTKSGLLKDSVEAARSGSGVSVQVVEQTAIDMLQEFGEPGDFMIAGSGVAAFDHPLIKAKMPDLNVWLAYYPFDIGVMRRTAKILAGKEIVSHTAQSYGDEKVHRAWEDVMAHLEEAKKYQTVLRQAFA